MEYIGTKHEVKATVTDEVTAAKMKSGSLAVLATPFMVALMEQAAAELCEKFTQEGISTVGTSLNIKHLAPTPVGAEVRAVAELLSFDGRKAEFKVEAYDEIGLIGEGTHERFTIKIDRFMEKANERKINN
ncbi:MAG: thioesterase family protein [Clostridia bacterium]|nr:thioesterase family protein [Clostridia bacterium]